MFELNHLRCFLAVAEELHFGRAARRLNMTQPPLSRQIRLLESAMEVRLLERTSRTVTLTAAGRHFQKESMQILRLADEAVRSTQQVSQGVAGTISVGFTQGSSYRFLPQLVALAKSALPSITISLNEMSTTMQIEALRYGRIDIGILQTPFERDGIEARRVLREPFILAVHVDHPLAKETPPRLQDINDQDLIMYAADGNPYFHALVGDVLHQAGITPRIVQHVNQTHTMLGLVGIGLGLAIVPQSTVKLGAQHVVFREFAHPPEIQAELHSAWLTSNDNPAFRLLRRLILGHFVIP